jgi:UDP-N-acetylmuramate--alanine ligase
MAGQIGVAIAGTHGKTTTTSMTAQILIDADFDPTVIVGGILPSINTNARAGKGRHFIIEADEYDNMFLGLDYQVAVINNIEHDHPDIFADDATYMHAFRQFAAQLPENGALYVNGDDPLAAHIHPAAMTVGLGEGVAIRATNIQPNNVGGSDFVAMEGDMLLGIIRLRVPGEHNVRNALMALSVACKLGVDFQTIRKSLGGFGGVGRRFQVVGTVEGVTVVDDYAHHPTEIEVTLAAARQRFAGRTIWAVWQPHTYSRTKLYFDKFTQAFHNGDKIIVLDIFGSRESDTLGMDSEKIVAAMKHPYARHIATLEGAAAYILDRIGATDVVLTLGAGDGNRVGILVLEGLDRRVNSW